MKILLKKLAAIFTMAALSLIIAACGAQGEKSSLKSEGSSKKGKILVAYFSRADENYGVGVITEGNTSILAKMIAEKTKADLFEIKPVKPYPKEYRPATEVAKVEKEEKARPEIVGTLPDMSKYDVIFLGYPIWWSDLPMAVYTFLEKENFEGKTIIPFCTHEGSGIGNTEQFIKETAKANMKPGLEIRGATVQNFRDEAKKEIENWLEKVGY